MPDPANPVRHLRVVEHDENGQVIPEHCPECQRRLDEIAGLQRDVKGWAVRYRELERDRNAEAEEHPCWEAAIWTFRFWQRATGHSRSRWSHDRFWLVEPFLHQGKWGRTLKARVARCCLAVEGARYDAFVKPRRNGSVKRFDDWDLIYRSTGQFEEFQKRAPQDARARWGAIIEAEAGRK